MNICHIINNLKSGGAQTFLFYLVSEQVKNNNVTVVILDKVDINDKFSNSLKRKFENNGIHLKFINRKLSNYVALFLSVLKLFWFFKKYRFDIVNTHLPLIHLCYGLIRNKHSNHVMTVHNGPEDITKLSMFLNRNIPKIYCSKSAYSLNNYPKCDYAIIENGVPFLKNKNITIINKEELLKPLGIPLKSKIVLSIGALRVQKNYSFLVNLVKEYYEGSETYFIVCGGYADDENFKELSEYKHIKNLHFIGATNKVEAYLDIADVFLSCSKFEGLPIAVLEAVFKGVSCVLSPIKQHIDTFKELDGVLIPENFEYNDFRKKINVFLGNNKDRKLILENREVFINNYSIENTSNSYLKYYSKIKGK